MTELVKNPFVFEGNQMRTVITENNEIMFCLKDVCNILGIGNVTDAKNRLNEKGFDSIELLTNGGMQQVLFINESNLYKCIFQSRKPIAERFTDWVTSEVLPSIRKNGGYIMNQETLTPEQIVANALILAEKKVMFNLFNNL